MNKKRKMIAIFLICIGIIGAQLCLHQINVKESEFEGKILVKDGVIEDVLKKHTKSYSKKTGRNTYHSAIVDIGGDSYEVFLNYGKEADYEINDIITCYGYNGKFYIKESSLKRNNINVGINFAGVAFFAFIALAGVIILFAKTKHKTIEAKNEKLKER